MVLFQWRDMHRKWNEQKKVKQKRNTINLKQCIYLYHYEIRTILETFLLNGNGMMVRWHDEVWI